MCSHLSELPRPTRLPLNCNRLLLLGQPKSLLRSYLALRYYVNKDGSPLDDAEFLVNK